LTESLAAEVGVAPIVDEAAEREALEAIVGERTLEIVGRRRQAAVVRRRGWLIRRLLLLTDLLGLFGAFLLAELIFAGTTAGASNPSLEIVLFGATLPGWVVVARLYGLYSQDDRRTNHTTVDEVANIFHMVTVSTWLFFAFTWLTGVAHPAVPKLLLFWALAATLLPVLRTGARARARSSVNFLQNAVIVGAGDVGQSVAEKLLRHPEYGINLVGFIDSEPREQRPSLAHLTILGPPERLHSVIEALDVERVIIAFSRDSHERVLELIRSLKDSFVQIDIIPRFFELIGPGVGISAVEGVPVLGLPPRALGLSSRVLKRSMDVAVSAVLLLLLLPALLVVVVLIKLDSRGPAFFRQPRVGAGGREFSIVKLRTMVAGADDQKHALAHLNKHASGDARMFKIPDDPRVTRIGRLLRRVSLDELPQLFNVLCGTMSLVGPRPLIPSEDEHVENWGRSRLDLKPGMTGLWQVLGRSDIPFEEMVRLDYLYVTSWSLWRDLRLLCATAPAMFKGGKGAY
jgi:exopolysaccharide biosynthesis polyprenyl glycosylphosphotransferase